MDINTTSPDMTTNDKNLQNDGPFVPVNLNNTDPDVILKRLADAQSIPDTDQQKDIKTEWINYLRPLLTSDNISVLLDRLSAHLAVYHSPTTISHVQTRFNGEVVNDYPSDPDSFIHNMLTCVEICDLTMVDQVAADLIKFAVRYFTDEHRSKPIVSGLVSSLSNQLFNHSQTTQCSLAHAIISYFSKTIGTQNYIHEQAFGLLASALHFIYQITNEKAHSGVSGKVSFAVAVTFISELGPWSTAHTIPLIDMFCDLPLSQELIKMIVNTILKKQLKPSNIDEDNMHLLIYHLILLASKLQTSPDRRSVIKSIVNLVEKSLADSLNPPIGILVDKQTALARHYTLESSILTHMEQALMVSQVMVTELHGYFKALKHHELTPFGVSLALMSSRRHLPLITKLCNLIESSIKQDAKIQTFKWLPGSTLFLETSVQNVIQGVIDRSVFYLAHMEQLIELACGLVEASSEALPGWKQNVDTRNLPYIPGLSFSPDDVLLAHGPPVQSLCLSALPNASITTKSLGQWIITTLYELHKSARSMILQCMRLRLETNSTGTDTFLKILYTISTDNVILAHNLAIEHAKNVDEYIGTIMTLHGPPAIRLASALVPLIRQSPVLRGKLKTLVSKLMINKILERRELSVITGVQMLAVAAQHHTYLTSFAFEMVDVLQKCMMMSADLRQLFYQQLIFVLTCEPYQTPKSIANYILPILYAQLTDYLDHQSSTINFDLLLDSNEDGPVIIEPLHWLIKAISVAIVQCDPNIPLIQEVVQKIATVANAMRGKDLTELGIPANVHVSLADPTQFKYYIRGNLIVSVYETIMELLVRSGMLVGASFSLSSNNSTIKALHFRSSEYAEFLRAQYLDVKGKKKSKVDLHCDATIIDPTTVLVLCKNLESHDLHLVLRLRMSLAMSLYKWIDSDHNGDTSKDELGVDLHNLVHLGREVLGLFDLSTLDMPTSRDRKERKLSVPELAVEALHSVITYILGRKDASRALGLILPITSYSENATDQVTASSHIGRTLIKVFDALYSIECLPESAKALNILSLVIPWLTIEQQADLRHVMMQGLSEGTIMYSDVNIVKSYLNVLVQLNWDNTENLEQMRFLSLHLAPVIGILSELKTFTCADDQLQQPVQDLDRQELINWVVQNTSASERVLIAFENRKVQIATIGVVLGFIEAVDSEVDFVLALYKTEFGTKAIYIPDVQLDAIIEFEHSVAKRLHAGLRSLHAIVHLQIPLESGVLVLKCLNRTFTTINQYLQIKVNLKTRPIESCVGLIKIASEIRRVSSDLQIHFEKLEADLDGRSKDTATRKKSQSKTKKSSKGIKETEDENFSKAGSSSCGVVGKELAMEDDELTSMSGSCVPKPDQDDEEMRKSSVLLKRRKAYARVTSTLVQTLESFDVLIITLAKSYKQLSQFVRRSYVHDFKLVKKR